MKTINLNEYQEAGSVGNNRFDTFRKIKNGHGTWVAKSRKTSNVFPISYQQALGYEPIDEQDAMTKFIGSKLMPKRI